MQLSANAIAFLYLLSASEGTARYPNPYAVCFGGKYVIQDFSDHPAILGVWKGELLSDRICRGAGLKPGCRSTAAGAYQIIKPTWAVLKKQLGLPDFYPPSQDTAVWVGLIDRVCRATNAIEKGDIELAIYLCRKQWASLPGAGYGQHENKKERLIEAYRTAGGMLV
jgi:muramidase (phage lysozyme)